MQRIAFHPGEKIEEVKGRNGTAVPFSFISFDFMAPWAELLSTIRIIP